MKLTPFAKLFIALVIVAATAYVVKVNVYDPARQAVELAAQRHKRRRCRGQQSPSKPQRQVRRQPAQIDRSSLASMTLAAAIRCCWPTTGPKPGPQSLFRQAGLDVEVRLIRGSKKERLKAFDDGRSRRDAAYARLLCEPPLYKQKGVELRSFLFVDWSRGNIGIAAKAAVDQHRSAADGTHCDDAQHPTHYFLLSLLRRAIQNLPRSTPSRATWCLRPKRPMRGRCFSVAKSMRWRFGNRTCRKRLRAAKARRW